MTMWPISCQLLILALALPCVSTFGQASTRDTDGIGCKPERVHLSYGTTSRDMVVMWETSKQCGSEVSYADHPWKLDLVVKAATEDLTGCGGDNCSLGFVHRAVLENLGQSSTVYYRPISNGVSVGPFYFHVPGREEEEPLQFFLASQATLSKPDGMVKSLETALFSHPLSAIFVLDKPQQLVCHKDSNVLKDMKDLANLPLMIGADTESNDDAACTQTMFSMPGHGWPLGRGGARWYSLDIGMVHVVVYSSKVFLGKDVELAKAMQAWMVEDLTRVNQRRAQTPWIVAVGSDPMYCQEDVSQQLELDCAMNVSRVRRGVEDIFYHFAVDLVLESQSGHYERTWPHYKNVVVSRGYDLPVSPVEVILADGTTLDLPDNGGNHTGKEALADWSAVRLKSGPDSYGHLSVANASHLLFQWRSAKRGDSLVLDEFWLVQEQHGNFSLAALPHEVSHRINQSIIAMGGKPGTYDFINTLTPDLSQQGEGWSKYSLWFGLVFVATAIVVGLGIVTIRSYLKRRRTNAGRRWREVDCQGSGTGHFYSMASDTDSDGDNDHDFEIDMFERSSSKSESKLLTSY